VSAKSSGKIHIKLLDVLCLQVIILHSPWRKHKKVEGVQQATQLGEIMTTWMNYFGNFSAKLLQTLAISVCVFHNDILFDFLVCNSNTIII
jgi:hypothetical protein